MLSGAQGVLESITRDISRTALQARNGIKHVAGIDRERVGQTPKETVWSRKKTQLWRYHTDAVVTQPVPIVIVYSVLSRSYMFDLHPGHSFVERLCDLGYDVYMLDWGVGDEQDSANDLEMYAEEHLPAALRAAAKASGVPSVFLVGYCFGGTLTLLSLAAQERPEVAGLVLMAAPVDYHKMGIFTELLGPESRINPADLIDHTGNVPASASKDIFSVMKPTSRVSAQVTFLERMWDDKFVKAYQAMGQWTRDNVPFPGAAFRQTVQQLFRQNGIVNNSLFLSGRRIDMSSITVPLLVVVAEKDHIVPLDSALAATDVVGSDDVEVIRLSFGHAGLVMGRAATGKTIPAILDWVERHTKPATKEN